MLESDEDRQRFKVQRRFQMRDGEKFFQEGRDQAQLRADAAADAAGRRLAVGAAPQRTGRAGPRRPRPALFQPQLLLSETLALHDRRLSAGVGGGGGEWFGDAAPASGPVDNLSMLGDIGGRRGFGGPGGADFDSLINLITSTVPPTTWDDVGGPGAIGPFETNLSLVISQTQSIDGEFDGSIVREELDELQSVDDFEAFNGRLNINLHGELAAVSSDKLKRSMSLYEHAAHQAHVRHQ